METNYRNINISKIVLNLINFITSENIVFWLLYINNTNNVIKAIIVCFLLSEEKTKICKHEQTARPIIFTSSPTLSKETTKTTGLNKWPYHLPENSGVSGTVYQMDGTYVDGYERGSKNSSQTKSVYSALGLLLTVLILHTIKFATWQRILLIFT